MTPVSDFIDEQNPAMVVFGRPWFNWATVPADGSHVYAVPTLRRVRPPAEVWFDQGFDCWIAYGDYRDDTFAYEPGPNSLWSPVRRRMSGEEISRVHNFFLLFSMDGCVIEHL